MSVGGGTVARSTGGPFSNFSANFNGTSDYLTLANASLGGLNIAGPGAQFTVVAWIRRDETNTGFIGGIWQENNNDPGRQYGLFVDLPTYGGSENVSGHVSFSGGSSPGLPFGRDCSANQTPVYRGEWTTVAFTFDGAYARSSIDAKFESRPTDTEPGPPLGQGRTYAKNPYYFPQGIGGNGGNFTVGAVQLTSGLGNFHRGQIGGLAVFDRALTARELFIVHAASLDPGAAASSFEFRNETGGNQIPANVAWNAFESPSTDSTTTRPFRHHSRGDRLLSERQRGSLRIDHLDIYVNLAAIPEPSSVALLGVAGLLATIAVRRRFRRPMRRSPAESEANRVINDPSTFPESRI